MSPLAMDVVLALKLYISCMIEDSRDGMKLLLMDKVTTGIISMVYTQTEMLQKEVFLFEHISTEGRESMKHMKAIVFIQPTQANIELLEQELKHPKYESYFLYFSNAISDGDLQILAQADEHELVQQVKEFYMEYIAVCGHVFTVNAPNCSLPSQVWVQEAFVATKATLISVLLSLKKSPAIRFQAGSTQCERLAKDLANIMKRKELFQFRQKDALPLLLILDRRDDPITPLLNQWTYQAMVHEMLSIAKNKVDLSKVADIPKDMREVVLSPEHDTFYKDNMYLNFGEIGEKIKLLVDEYQLKYQSHATVETISEMKAFVENYPEFRKLSGTVSKHVAIMGELSRLVKAYNLMGVSEIEQDMVANSDHTKHLNAIRNLLSKSNTSNIDALRLSLIYALKYERNSSKNIEAIKELLSRIHASNSDRCKRLLDAITEYGGYERRGSDLFGTASPLAFTKKLLKGFKDVENIYTQHSPLLTSTLELLLKGKLKDAQYPYATSQAIERPQDIIVFMVGGVTYEETLAIHEVNRQHQGAARIIIGGTYIHNCRSFLDEVLHATYAGSASLRKTTRQNP